MSDYTITLKRICDVYGKNEVASWFKDYNLSDYLTTEQASKILENNVFNSNTLANLALNHYYFREIAFETPEMFHHYLSVKLKELMGKYAPLIYSYSLSYNPLELKTIDIKEVFNKNKNTSASENETKNGTSETSGLTNSSSTITGNSQTSGNSTSNSTSNGSSLNVESDTPQGQISKTDILQGKWATKTGANENTNTIQDTTTSSSTNSMNNTDKRSEEETTTETTTAQNNSSNTKDEIENYEKSTSGYDYKISKTKLLEEYRKNIINIYEQIVNELNPLFFALF